MDTFVIHHPHSSVVIMPSYTQMVVNMQSPGVFDVIEGYELHAKQQLPLILMQGRLVHRNGDVGHIFWIGEHRWASALVVVKSGCHVICSIGIHMLYDDGDGILTGSTVAGGGTGSVGVSKEQDE